MKPDTLHDDRDYILEGRSTWITVGGFSVYIIRTDEGVVVDIYAHGREMEPAIASTWAHDNDLMPEED